MIFSLALALALDSPVPVEEPPRLWAWPTVSAGPRFTDGGTALVGLGFSYRFADYLEPEAFIGFGLHGIDNPEVIDRFSFGLRIVAPIDDDVRPFLWLALHHEHQAAFDAVAKNPIAATLGVSAEGVAHYTGAEAGGGIALAVPVDDNVFQVQVRTNLVWLPSLGGHVAATDGEHDHAMHDQLALLVDLSVGLPLQF